MISHTQEINIDFGLFPKKSSPKKRKIKSSDGNCSYQDILCGLESKVIQDYYLIFSISNRDFAILVDHVIIIMEAKDLISPNQKNCNNPYVELFKTRIPLVKMDDPVFHFSNHENYYILILEFPFHEKIMHAALAVESVKCIERIKPNGVEPACFEVGNTLNRTKERTIEILSIKNILNDNTLIE